MLISLIAAMDGQRVIGKNGKLPWHYAEDLQYFKEITENHIVVMGRATFESLGRPLPNRKNIIISHQSFPDIESYTSKERFLEQYRDYEGEIFVIGGAKTYESFLANAQKIYLTRIKKNYDGDTFFPFFESDFDLISEQRGEDLGFLIYTRKKSI